MDDWYNIDKVHKHHENSVHDHDISIDTDVAREKTFDILIKQIDGNYR